MLRKNQQKGRIKIAFYWVVHWIKKKLLLPLSWSSSLSLLQSPCVSFRYSRLQIDQKLFCILREFNFCNYFRNKFIWFYEGGEFKLMANSFYRRINTLLGCYTFLSPLIILSIQQNRVNQLMIMISSSSSVLSQEINFRGSIMNWVSFSLSNCRSSICTVLPSWTGEKIWRALALTAKKIWRWWTLH